MSQTIVAGGEPAARLTITSLAALKATADPLRLRLVQELRRAPLTVKELASSLAVNPKALYYHVNALERHGLIRVVETRLVSGILERRYRASAYLFEYVDLVDTADATPPPIQEVAALSSVLEITRDELRCTVLVADRETIPSPLVDWCLLRLTRADAAALHARLHALIEEYPAFNGEQSDDEGADTYRLLLTLFPTDHRQPPAS